MIEPTVTFLVRELNEYIQRKTGIEETYVDLRHMGNNLDDPTSIPAGRMGCSVINVEEERIGKRQRPMSPPVGGNTLNAASNALVNPEIRLNVFLLFAANPTPQGTGASELNLYSQALKLLDFTISFFQGKHVFTTENSPNLNSGIQSLYLDLISIPLEEQSYLWGALSASYLPSVVYRVRLVSVQDDNIQETAPPLEIIEPRFSPL